MAEEAESAAKTYNTVFERLVDDEDEETEIVGMLAYALYKQSKREWVIENPNDKDGYRLTTRDLGRLRDQAEQMLISYASVVVDAERPEIEKATRQEHLIAQVESLAREIEGQNKASLASMVRQNTLLRQMLSGAVGAFGYSLVLLVLYGIVSWLGVDFVNVFNNANKNIAPQEDAAYQSDQRPLPRENREDQS